MTLKHREKIVTIALIIYLLSGGKKLIGDWCGFDKFDTLGPRHKVN